MNELVLWCSRYGWLRKSRQIVEVYARRTPRPGDKVHESTCRLKKHQVSRLLLGTNDKVMIDYSWWQVMGEHARVFRVNKEGIIQ